MSVNFCNLLMSKETTFTLVSFDDVMINSLGLWFFVHFHVALMYPIVYKTCWAVYHYRAMSMTLKMWFINARVLSDCLLNDLECVEAVRFNFFSTSKNFERDIKSVYFMRVLPFFEHWLIYFFRFVNTFHGR